MSTNRWSRLARAMILALTAAAFANGENLPATKYSAADGLLRDSAACVVEDSRGFIWFCTSDGLSRFDGHVFHNYTTYEGLPNRRVTSFLETSAGERLVGTSDGLALFQPYGAAESNPSDTERSFFTVFRPASGESASNEITYLFEDHLGRIWCGTSDGLFRIEKRGDGIGFVEIQVADREPSKPLAVTSVAESGDFILAGLDYGAGVLRVSSDDHAARIRARREGGPDESVKSLFRANDGSIRVGLSVNGGFCVFNPLAAGASSLSACLSKQNGLPTNWIQTVYQTASGDFWLGTTAGAVKIPIDGSALKRYGDAEGVCDKGVDAFREDRDGNLWIATNCGVRRVAVNGLVRYSQSDGLGSVNLRGVFRTREGELYFTTVRTTETRDGKDTAVRQLARFSSGRFESVEPTIPASAGWGSLQIFLRDSLNRWWLPGAGGAAYRFPQTRGFSDLRNTAPIAIPVADAEIFRLYEDRRGTIWISTMYSGRLLSISRGESNVVSHGSAGVGDGKPRHINSFAETADGALWMGAEYSGDLLRYRDGRFEVVPAESRKAGSVTSILCDSRNRIWFTTMQNGVGRIEDTISSEPAIRWYNRRDGLSTDGTRGLAEDDFGRIYVGHGRGVDRIDPASGSIRHFSTRDGLPPGLNDVIARDRDGAIWIGGQNGIARLTPGAERPRTSPKILLTGLRIAGNRRTISELGETRIESVVASPGEGQLIFEFVGIGDGLTYEYRLGEGQWIATEQRVVEFANLAAGDYRFEVRARTDDGLTSEEAAIVIFSVAAPVWQRWWFLLAAAAAAGLVAYVLYRYRVSQMLRVERLRTRIATDLHDDIGANLSTISVLSEVARLRAGDRSDDYSKLLDTIAGTARDSVSSMSDIVWAINPQRDSLVELTRRMRQFAEETFVPNAVTVNFESSVEEQKKLPMDRRRGVYLVFKEAVSNAARHSGCATVDISFEVNENGFVLRFSDDGRGFDTTSDMGGNGIENMKARAAAAGGHVDIVTAPGRGTTVTLTIPAQH